MKQRVALCAALALVLVFASGGAEGAAKTPTVILGSGLAGPYVHYPVAVEKGFFTKHGLKAELRVFAEGFEALQAASAGAVHMSNGGELSLITLRSKGANLVVVARNVVNESDLGIGASRDIKQPRDLIGKKCGVILGGSQHWYARRFASTYGFKLEDIKLVNMYPPEWLPSLARGDISCFFGHEPFLTQLAGVVRGGHVLHRNGQDNVYILQNLLGFNAAWVKNDPDGAKAALRAMIDTMDWVNANRREAAAIAAKAFQMDAAVLEKLMACCQYRIDFPQKVQEAVAEMAAWAFEEKKSTMRPEELRSMLLYPDLLKEVAPDRCTAEVCK